MLYRAVLPREQVVFLAATGFGRTDSIRARALDSLLSERDSKWFISAVLWDVLICEAGAYLS